MGFETGILEHYMILLQEGNKRFLQLKQSCMMSNSTVDDVTSLFGKCPYMIEKYLNFSSRHCLQDIPEQRKDFLVLFSKKGKGEMEVSFARWVSFREIGSNGTLDGSKLL
jgi:hypothetical protein